MRNLKGLHADQRGSAFAWMTILISIFIVILLWVVLTEPIDQVTTAFENRMPTDNAVSTFNALKMVWNIWPIILIIFLVIYGIMNSLKREYDTGMM